MSEPVRPVATMKSTLLEKSSSSLQSESQQKDWKTILKKGLAQSTFHGIPDLVESSTRFWRCFWLLLVIGSTFAFICETVMIIQDYKNHPLMVKTFEQKLEEFQVPPLAVCTKWLFDKTKLRQFNLRETSKDTKQLLLYLSYHFHFEEDYSQKLKRMAESLNLGLPFRPNLLKHLALNFSALKFNLQPEAETTLSFMQNHHLEIKKVKSIGVDPLGMCFLVHYEPLKRNWFSKRSLILGASLHKPENGYQLFEDGPDFLLGWDFSEGNNWNNLELNVDDKQNKFEITQTRFVHFPTDATPCSQSRNQDVCLARCHDQVIERLLNCTRDPWHSNLTECSGWESAKEGMNHEMDSCMNGCLPPCSEDRWSIKRQKRPFFSIYHHPQQTKTFLLELLVKDAFNLVVFEEVMLYTWDMFLGNIGGLAGLWLGASLLSIIQLFAFCLKEAST